MNRSASPRARVVRTLLVVVAQLAASVGLLVATIAPASAFDAAVTIDAGGGTNASNGLRIMYGSGQMQTYRLGTGQYYQPATNPGAATAANIYNGVYLAVGTTVVGPLHGAISGSAPAGFTLASWDTITATGGSTGTGGTISSTLTKTLGGLQYQVLLTISYTYPFDYYTVTYDTIIPNGNAATVKLYHGIDNYLGGSDLGPGFYSAGPTQIVGVYNATAFEAFRYRAGIPWTNYWEVFYGCLYKNISGNCPSGPHINNAGDFPNTIDTNASNDASMGVEYILGSTPGSFRTVNDIAFGDLRPSVGADFGASSIELGQSTTATFTVWAAADKSAQSGLSFTGTLPAGINLSNATVSNTCGGTVTDGAGAGLAAGSHTVRLTGGALAVNAASCTLTVNITPGATGTYAMGPAELTNLSAQLRNDAPLEILAVTLPAADLAAAASTPTIVPGATGTSTVTVTDNGPGAVVASTVTYTPPAGASVSGSLPAGCSGSATVTCTVGSLTSGASTTFAIPLRVQADATPSTTLTGGSVEVSSPNRVETTPANDRAAASVTTGAASADVVLTATTPSIVPGLGGTVTLTATNNGPSDATGPTTFTYVAPAGVTVGTLPSGCSGTTTITCTVTGRLGAGAAVSVGLPVSIAASAAPGSLTGGSVSVTATTADPNLANNTLASSTVTVAARTADVALSVTTPAIAPGASGTVTLTVTDLGPSDAAGPITITYSPPAGVTVGSLPAGCTGTGPVTCTIAGPITPGSSSSVAIPVSLSPSTPAGTVSGGSASVSSPSSDPSTGNNTVNPTTIVTASGSADLSVRVSTPTIAPGATGTVVVTASNDGPSNATGPITYTYAPPTGVTVVTGSLPAGCSGTTTITCTIAGTLNAGTSSSVSIPVKVASSAAASSSVAGGSASVASTTTDPVPADNSVATTTVLTGPASADLSVSASTPTLAPGATGTATVTVTDNGPSDVAGATVTYQAPAGVTVVSGSVPAGCTVSGSHVTCTVGAIAAGGTGTVAIPVQVASDATASTTLTGGSVAVAPTGATDPTPGNDLASASVTTSAASADLAITVSTPTIVPGAGGVVDVAVTDNGPSDAAGPVTVTYTPPNGVTVEAGVLPSGCTGTTTVTCTITGPIPAGSAVHLAITVIEPAWASGASSGGSANVSGPTTDPTAANNSVSSPLITAGAPSVDMVLSSSSPTLTPGTSGSITLTAYNNGLSDTPGPLTYTYTSPTGVTVGTLPSGCSGTTTITCSVAGVVAAGGSSSVTLPVNLAPSVAPGAVTGGSASVASPSSDPVAPNNTITPTLTAGPRSADVVASVSTPSIPPGGTGTVTITATDNGPSDAVGPTTFTYTPPAGVTVVIASLPAGCTGTTTITCIVAGTIAAAGTATVGIVVSLPLSATSGSTLTGGSASATTPTTDPNASNNNVASTSVTVAPASADIVLTSSSTTVTPGSTGTVTLTATNQGPSNAAGPITFTYTPPSNVTVVTGSLPAGCSGTTTITCSVAGTVAPNATAAVTLPITVASGATPSSSLTGGSATATSPTADPAAPNNTALTTSVSTGAAVANVGVTASTPTIVPGATGISTLTVTDAGPSNSGPVTVTYTPPAGIAVVTGSLPAGCSGTTTITCTVAGGVVSGGNTTIAIPLQPASNATAGSATGGSVSATATATDPTPANNSAAAAVTIAAPQADVAMTVSSPAIAPGGTGSVVLTVTDNGPSDATGVTVSYTPPTNVTVVTASLPAGCTGGASGPITCTVGTVPTGTTATVVLPLAVSGSVVNGTTLSGGSASASTGVTDPAAGNNTATSSILAAAGTADIAITANTPSIVPGTTGTVTLTVHDNGPNDAVAPHITYTTPAGVTPISAGLPAGCTITGSTVNCVLPQPLANGATTTVLIPVSVPAAAAAGTDSGGSSNVTSPTNDPTVANNTASSNITVAPPRADVAITNVSTPSLLPSAAGNVVVGLVVNGPSNAGAFDVVYSLPAGLNADTGAAAWDTRCSAAGSAVTCHFTGPFAPAATASLTIPVVAAASPPATFMGGTVALANTAVTDPVVANNGPIAANPERLTAVPRPFYVPVNPERFLDTRTGLAHAVGRTTDGEVIQLQITGTGATNIPADASAVVLNMTADDPAQAGFVTVWPCGETMPNASNLNGIAGITTPNLVMAEIGAGGQVCIYTQHATHLVADVNGWFPANVPFHPVQPERLLDTRTGVGLPAPGLTNDGTTIELQVTGTGATNIPADAAAVVLNVTVDQPQADGYVTLWPCGQARPDASNLNATAGQSAPNLVIAKIGAGGKVCIFTQHATHVVADVNGWLPAGTPYVGVVPERLLDTRTGVGVPAPGRTTDGTVIELQITGTGATNIPADASAVALNMTVTGPGQNGFVTVWPCGETMPNASNLNGTVPYTRPNMVIAKIGAGGKVCVYTQHPDDVVADVNGWFPKEPALPS